MAEDGTKGPEDAVLREIRSQFAAVREDVSRDMAALNRRMTENTDRQLAAHERTRQHVVHVTAMTSELWTEVFGSRPPPPPPERDAELSFALSEKKPEVAEAARTPRGARRIREQVSEHDATLDGIHGRLLAFDGRQTTMENQIQEILTLQKEQMGKAKPEATDLSFPRRVVERLVWSFTTRPGHKFVLTLIAALTSLVTALGTSYALFTGRLPLPSASSSVPAYVAPPTPAPAASGSVRGGER